MVGLGLTGLGVDGLDELDEPAGGLSGVAVEDRGVSDGDDGRVVQDDDLSGEGLGDGRRVVDRSGDVSPLDVVLGNSTDVESDVVSRESLGEGLVVHLDGLDLSDDMGRLEHDLHVGLEDTGLDTSDRNGSDTGDGIDILDRNPEGLLGVLLGNLEVVESLDEGGALVPSHVGGGDLDVVSGVCGDGDEGNLVGLDSDHLHQLDHGVLGLVVLGLVELDGIHLVDGDDDLLDAQGGGEEDVLLGLSLGTLDGAAGDDGCIGLGGTGDHVLDEVAVSGSVDDGEEVLVGVELLVGDIDGDSSLPLLLESIHDPSEVEGSLSFLLGLLLVLLDEVGVDSASLQQDPSSEGGLAVVDVADDDQIHVLFLCHFFSSVWNAIFVDKGFDI